MKKRIAVILLAVLTLCFSGCSSKSAVKTTLSFDREASANPLADGTVAENENFRLEWDMANMSVVLTDKRNGTKWGTSPIETGEPKFDEFGMPIKRHPQLESALSVEYMDAETETVNTSISYTGAVQDGRIVCEELENGMRTAYYFDDAEFMIPVDYILKEDGLAVSINPDAIEEGDNQILTISLAPYLCSLTNNAADGYFMVPAGSGGLVHPKEVSQSGSVYSMEVYGEDLARDVRDNVSDTEATRLPVYGVKNGDTAVCAVIEGAADSAAVEVRYGSTAVGYSAVYTKFQYRASMSNTIRLFYGVATENQINSDTHITETMTVGFYPLFGQAADYNGMAQVYRNYLKEKGYLSGQAEESALHLQMIGGVMTEESFFGIPYQKLYAATTLTKALEIVKEVQEETDTSLSISLKGFGKSGINIGKIAGGYGIGHGLGSVSDLQVLSSYCEQKDIPFFMDFDLVHFKQSGSGVSRISDSVKNVGEKTAYQYDFQVATLGRLDDTKYQLLQRTKLVASADKLMNKAEKWQLNGIALGTLSNVAYSDFSDSSTGRYCAKNKMSSDVASIFQAFRKNGFRLCAEQANDYAAVNADAVIGVPLKSDQSDIIAEDIPFYQLVFKGYIPLNGESVNLEAEPDTAILQSIEGGSGLTFTLTADYDIDLVKTGKREFFNSLYLDLKDYIVNRSEQLKQFYNKVNGIPIAEHKIVADGLRKTVYENGVTVYVNYGDAAAETELGSVEPHNFLVGES